MIQRKIQEGEDEGEGEAEYMNLVNINILKAKSKTNILKVWKTMEAAVAVRGVDMNEERRRKVDRVEEMNEKGEEEEREVGSAITQR